jgi:tRNA A-37 threonylcarbamoyl transferase component Bud32
VSVEKVARKSRDPVQLGIEAAKTAFAARLAAKLGSFDVPEVLPFAPGSSVLEFKWIEGLQTLAELAAAGDPRVPALCSRAGAILASVHAELSLPPELTAPLPAAVRPAGQRDVYFHGDYTPFNVCFNSARDRLVLVDWSSAAILEQVATFGPRCFDLAWFVACLFNSRSALWGYGSSPHACGRALLAGYNDAALERVSPAEFQSCREAIEPWLVLIRRNVVLSRKGLGRVAQRLNLSIALRQWRRFDPGLA